jgi:outer membrane protein insertion porin family
MVSLTEPYFLDYQLAVGLEAFYHDATFYSNDYDERHIGSELFVRKALTQNLYWRIAYRLEQIRIYDVARHASDIIKRDEGDWVKSQINPSLVYDTRDSVFLTRKGTRSDLSAYVTGDALGGDENIYGGDLKASQYFSLPWDTILTFSGRVATVKEYGSTDHVPIFDRLYLGGSGDLRGFKYRGVGPKDQRGEPIGGNTLGAATVEYTWPIIDRVRGALFYDIGFVNADSWSWNPDNLASDYGLGIRFDLPIGPIRIDYGIPIERGDSTGSKKGQFNFSIGYQF